MAIERVQRPTSSKSGGSNLRRIVVIHISAGATTNDSLAGFIQNPANQVSYHISVDNTRPGVCYEYVKLPDSSWSVASYNGVSVNGCICAAGEAQNYSRQQWLDRQDVAISNLAAWVGEECKRTGIPLVALTASQAQGNSSGVCQHRDLGSAGGGHNDCGPYFPMDILIERAKGGSTPPKPTGPDWAYLYGTRETDYMGTVKNGLPLPRPRDVTHLRLFGSVPPNGYISVTVRQYVTNSATPHESAVRLTPEQHRADVALRDNTDGYVTVISGNSPEVGYCFI